MFRLGISLLTVVLFATIGCASSGVPEVRQMRPDAVGGDTEPLIFTRLVVRVPAGTEIGGHHEGLLKIKHDSYTWDGNISIASDEFRIIAAETMKKYGFRVSGGDDIIFGKDESAKATYQLGGTVRDLRYNTYGDLAGDNAEAWLKVEWQVNNALQEKIVFSDTTLGRAEHADAGSGVAAVKGAFRSALTNLLANDDFIALVTIPGDSLQAGLATATRREMLGCLEPAAVKLPEETEQAFQAAPVIRVGSGHGSGVVISSDGYLLTAAHVVSGVDRATVQFRSGLELDARVLEVDPAQDVALLKLPGSGHPCLALSLESPAPVGTEIYAIGAPRMEELSFSVSKGVVSGHRTLNKYQFLQTDASVNPGNSGGPLLDGKSTVVGIVSFKIAGRLYEGLGFGIPPEVFLSRLGIELQ